MGMRLPSVSMLKRPPGVAPRGPNPPASARRSPGQKESMHAKIRQRSAPTPGGAASASTEKLAMDSTAAQLSCEVLVVGAGLAGLVAAIGFERAGFDVILCGRAESTAGGRTV